MLDIIIRNACLVDGLDNDIHYCDIGIKSGKICAISSKDIIAKTTIDAMGDIVCPGFIDMHSHADAYNIVNKGNKHRVLQGVTSEIVGNCGFSIAPINTSYLVAYQDYTMPILGKFPKLYFVDFKSFIAQLEKSNLHHNVGAMVGSGTLRVAVKGYEKDRFSDIDFNRYSTLLRESFDSGALGLSMGLMYSPENFFDEKELIRIANIVADYNKIITVHMRNEGNHLQESIQEIINIAKASNAHFHISHLKSAGKSNWGHKIDKALSMIDLAQREGVNISADAYPYTAGSTTILSLLPPWASEGNARELIKKLDDYDYYTKIIYELNNDSEIWDNIVHSTGWQSVRISSLENGCHKKYIGKTIADISKDLGISGAECVLKLIKENNANIGIVIFHMDKKDVEKVIKRNYVNIASDSIYADSDVPHPRKYGTFAKFISEYAIGEKTISLTSAINKCTYLPAKRMSLKNRGYIAEGAWADVLILNKDKLKDNATYDEPKHYPDGIGHVIVNGRLVSGDGLTVVSGNGRVL